ncbi:MAG: T9SS type A sorting domain-containing protein [Bacteroidia bacterium]|nr:T9SS type A sorting domain-containing protein [Bacteroidia bacterium]
MKIRLLSFFLVLISCANAQIVITTSNVPASGDTARMSLASVVALTTNTSLTSYTVTGANFTWNFDSLKPVGQIMREFKPANAYGYFLSTGYAEKTDDTLDLFIAQLNNVCDIYKKNTNGFYMDAWGITYSGFPIPVSYSKKDSIYKFPLNYLDRDSTNFALSTPSSSLMPFGFKKHGHRITEVDGWGSIKTPFGMEPCLRVVTTQYSIDSIKASIPVGTFTLPINIGYPNYVRKYQWLTLTEHVPYLEITGTVALNNFIPNEVRYRDMIRSFTGIKESPSTQMALAIYPNPATNQINFIIPSQGEFEISIMDMQGRIISKHKFDNRNSINQNSINIEALAQGIYSGRITNGNAVQNFKFVKE